MFSILVLIGGFSRGYVALDRFPPGIEAVFILAFRSQREAGHQCDG